MNYSKGNTIACRHAFESRVFMPWLGTDEDYVCGVAHLVLTPYWTKQGTKLSFTSL